MRRKPPKYALHKATGMARVRIKGKDFYLGPFGSAESHHEYLRLISGIQAENGKPVQQPGTHAVLANIRVQICNGTQPGELCSIRLIAADPT